MHRIYRPSRKRKLPSRPKPEHRALRRHPPAFSWLYDGRDLLAVLERRSDGWRVLMRGRDDIGRTFETREEAVAAALEAAGVAVAIAFSLDEALATFEAWGLLRGHAAIRPHNSNPVAGQGNARRELHLERRAKGNRDDEQFNVQRR